MPIPKNVSFVTFDVYGALIDWETGIYDAFAKEAARDGVEIDRGVLIPMFHEIEREIEGGSYELYAEVLRRTAIEIAKRLEWQLEPSRSGFLPDSVQRWAPFKETNIQLQKMAKKYKLGLLSNVDDKLLGQTRRHIPIDFDLVVTAQQVRSYKPEPPHFTECARRMGGKRGWVHVAASHYHDVALRQSAGARHLGEPQQGDARLLAEEAHGGGGQPERGRQAARRHLDPAHPP
jgi:2-haloacid dehalogenase